MVFFGQLVVGPPGSGKTTYCEGIQMFCRQLGRRCEVVNLDFANDELPYSAVIDVRDLVALERVMEECQLGPNGGLVYCMDHLVSNIHWLETKIAELDESTYLLFDCPGQVGAMRHFIPKE